MKKQERGITLIALVVTIIVLLILAGVAISLTIGDNGLFKRAESASKEHMKAEIKAELEMSINEIQLDKIIKEEPITKKDIAEYLSSSRGVVIIDYTDDIIDGEYENYQIVIDKNNKVSVGGLLTGAKPIIQFTKSTNEEGVDNLELTVKGLITEGEIESIESMDGLIPKTVEGNLENNSEKVYEITENKEYRFKVTGTNGRIGIDKITISSIIIERESLLAGIEEITNSGRTHLKVIGSTSTEKYSLNVIYHKGDLTLGDELKSGEEIVTIDGLSYDNNNTYTCGKTEDINRNTVVLKVDGNLEIITNKKLTSVGNSDSGSKGLIVYCTGELINNR